VQTIFHGESEMARLCRSHDWESTPLGAPEGWPQALKTLVSTLLASRHPMFLFWGPELVQFYNDAYRPSLGADGTRHPAALGARGRAFWADDWEDIGPQVEQVLSGGGPTWHENRRLPMTRNGQREVVYWTYGYSAVRSDDGSIGGVLVLCQETTAQVEADARLRASADRLTGVLESITDAFLTLDREWRVTFINTEGERVLERAREDLLGRVVWDEFPEAVGSTFQLEYERALREGRSVQFREFFPPLDRWFDVSAYPSDGGIAIYFRDVTERVATEERLRDRERLLGIAGRMARIGGWVVDLESGECTWSREVCDIHDVPHGTRPSVEEALTFYVPESFPVVANHFRRCVEEGVPYDLELQIRTARGRRVWVRTIGEAIVDADGRVRRVQGAFQEIEAQKKAEEALREGDRRFRELAESMPLVVWSADPDGRVDYQTRAVQEFTGRSASELAGDQWFDVLHPDDREPTARAWARSLETGEPYEVRFRILRRDGEWRWHLTRAQPYRDRNGEIVKWYGSSVDVHHELELQREAEALARRLTTTLESVTDAFLLLDPEWRFSFANEEAERLLERSRSEMLGGVIWDLFPVTAGTGLERRFRAAAEDGVTASFRYHYPPLERWFDIRAYPSAEGVAVYFRDVTAEREVETRLKEQAALLERAQDAILVRDLEHRAVFWNAGATRIYGWSAEEAIGADVREMLYEGADAFDEATEAVLRDGEWHGELEQTRKDGTSVTVEGRWSIVRDEEGNAARILAINTDVTERKRLLAQFLRAQRMESIGTLAGGIAHDLNNVLAPILMSIGLLREEVSSDEAREVLDSIERSAERGADMVRQVLGFARGFDRSDHPVDLTRVVEDLCRVARDTFPKNVAVRAELDPELWTMKGDPTQVHQVLMNLFVNARDAMPGGGTLRVVADNTEIDEHYAAMTADASPGPYVRLTVADSGEGMSPEVLSQIFDPFFTTKEVGKGTGLGLSTAAAIVRSHGGFLHVYSEPGTGTTFRVCFPAVTGIDAKAAVPPGIPAEPARGRGEMVLVIDDESTVREVTRQTLEAFGYRVMVAADGAEAVALYGRHGDRIDLVLTDMVMPVMDGPVTVRALKRMNPHVRVIGASGLGADGGIARASELGVRHFLSKPYTAETLLGVVNDVLTREGAE
jgi:PAS domain S-box-containing protein